MPKGYQHFTVTERYQLKALLDNKKSIREISQELCRSPSTISRELQRNSINGLYFVRPAQELTDMRRKDASSKRTKLTSDNQSLIRKMIQMQFSPQQISGRIKKLYNIHISHECIYQYIWLCKQKGDDLYKNLRRSGRKYNRRSKGKAGRGCIPNRVGIEKRPKIVDDKVRIGDWEIDLIVGSGHKGFIVSMVDRASKLTILEYVKNKTAKEVAEALVRGLYNSRIPVHTLTSDNGKEFSMHEFVSNALDAGFYFANPYHSWERPVNEFTNGLVRQYLPKGCDFSSLTDAYLKEIENKLNNRPRAILEYKTPLEYFFSFDVSDDYNRSVHECLKLA